MQKFWPFLVVGVAAFFAIWYIAMRQGANKSASASAGSVDNSGWNFEDVYGGAAEGANDALPAADTFGRLQAGAPFDNSNSTQAVADFNSQLASIANTFGVTLSGSVPQTGVTTSQLEHGGVVKTVNGTTHYADGTIKFTEPDRSLPGRGFTGEGAVHNAAPISDKVPAPGGNELHAEFSELTEAG